MSPKTYLRILQGGLIASLLAILLVFKELLFPYITSKQLPFNIIMEFLLVIWVVFLMRYPQYRPKKNLISYGLIAYFLAILASCVVSIDFNLSFWGDAERMLGFFHLAHFLIFYFIVITAFRTWQDWRTLFLSSVVVATIVSLNGLLGSQQYSTIGNTAYVSGYLIFNIYFIILLFFRSSNKSARWLYLIPFLIMLIEFWKMRTSGAIIGLGASFLLLFLLLGLSHVNKKIRRGSLVAFLASIALLVFIFSQSQAAWFQNSFLRNLTSQKATFQTRLISWQAAAKDFKNHPIFGNGFGNYSTTFDKYFDSKFYNYATSDTYFDRAHNNLVEIASTTGSVGLLAYLSIFVAAFYYLWREFRLNGKRVGGHDAGGLNNLEIIIIVSLISAYFIQNLAIFDSFSTFLGLMVILGFVYWLNFRRHYPAVNDEPENAIFTIKSDKAEAMLLIGLLIFAYIFANHYNFKTLKLFKGTIDAYVEVASGRLISGIDKYSDILEGAPMERDSRVTLINMIASNPTLLTSVNSQSAGEILDYTIDLARLNVAYNPYDSMMQMQLAQVLDAAARYYYNDLEKFNIYSGEAMQAIDRSIEATPGRATVYFIKSHMHVSRGEIDEAVEVLEKGISLNPNYYEGHCRLANLFLLTSEEKGVYDDRLDSSLQNCLDKGRVSGSISENLLKLAANYYSEKKDYQKAAEFSEHLAEVSEPSAEIWNNVARLYFIIGEKDKAESAFSKALDIDPSVLDSWVEFKSYVEENRKEFE